MLLINICVGFLKNFWKLFMSMLVGVSYSEFYSICLIKKLKQQENEYTDLTFELNLDFSLNILKESETCIRLYIIVKCLYLSPLTHFPKVFLPLFLISLCLIKVLLAPLSYFFPNKLTLAHINSVTLYLHWT